MKRHLQLLDLVFFSHVSQHFQVTVFKSQYHRNAMDVLTGLHSFYLSPTPTS